ncbi:MAG: squalene/phytoene synthase family protein [Planctomycetes bacterium]|nr:squalene/phytoene synthase family protein [Planctomycetota bacterium]
MSIAERPASAAFAPADVTRSSGSNFLAGFVCLDAARRDGMTAIYAFCRVADDAVDDAPDAATGAAHLEFWRQELDAAACGRAATPVGRSVQAAMQRFGVAPGPLADLLDGVATDLRPQPFADDAELERYCYRVASAVGLACLPVLGADSAGARVYAEALGHALQRTNILRDLKGDAADGRCYVPATWLAAAGCERDWLAGLGPDAAYAPDGAVARIRAQLAAAAAACFARAHAALRQLPRAERRALVPARIMGAIYGELLRVLRSPGVDGRGPRVRIGKGRKAWLALQVFAGVRP